GSTRIDVLVLVRRCAVARLPPLAGRRSQLDQQRAVCIDAHGVVGRSGWSAHVVTAEGSALVPSPPEPLQSGVQRVAAQGEGRSSRRETARGWSRRAVDGWCRATAYGANVVRVGFAWRAEPVGRDGIALEPSLLRRTADGRRRPRVEEG